jgi:hypothetical protein
MDSVTNRQQHLVIRLPDELHIISILQIRQLAAGECYNGDKSAMIQILAKALKDSIDEPT